MAKYTITLRELLKRGFEIFDDSWTTYDPDHKPELCNKIIRRYYFYEIGVETAERFKFNLNEHLARIMPYYNQLYMSELLKLEPLYDYMLETSEDTDRNKGRRRGVGQMADTMLVREMVESIKRIAEGTGNLVGNQNTTGHETWEEDGNHHTSEVTDQDTSEDTTMKVDTVGKMVDEKKEVMTDELTGTKTTDTTSTTDTSSTRRYSDTPQGTVTTSGVGIDRSYLTNYTAETGDSKTVGHSDESLKNNESRTTDTTETKDTTETQDTTKTVNGTNDKTVTTDGTTHKDGSKDTTGKMDETEDTKTTSKEHDFSDGKESSKKSETSYLDESVTEGEKEKRKHFTKGFNVAQSELLMRYRQTFLNIDAQIIEELVTNFMGVF